ncbi:MAG: hypothetical protein HXY24_16580, partial [Rubrivivax sp.]|nr:hypothetical protein [Rubrivivax sp.]
GIPRRKQLSKYWFLLTIAIPVLLLIPYFVVFIKMVTIQGITQRHGKLLGINHLKFLYYTIRFAPLIFLTGIFYRIRKKTDYFVLTVILVFFIVLGFYYPYLRLAYPIIPFLSLFSAGFLSKFKKMRYYMLAAVLLLNILIGYDTIVYGSKFSPSIGKKIDTLCSMQNIRYIFAHAPPNIIFYLNGIILQPEGRIPVDLISKSTKYLKKPEIMNEDNNLFRNEKEIVLVHSSVLEDSAGIFNKVRQIAELKDSVEFVDAPIYYKDIFNDLRAKKQIYEIYILNTAKLDTFLLDDFWKIGFHRGFTVIRK